MDLCSLGNDGMATAGSGDVLSGLLADDVDAIVGEYGELGDVAVTFDGEWAAMVVRRPT